MVHGWIWTACTEKLSRLRSNPHVRTLPPETERYIRYKPKGQSDGAGKFSSFGNLRENRLRLLRFTGGLSDGLGCSPYEPGTILSHASAHEVRSSRGRRSFGPQTFHTL